MAASITLITDAGTMITNGPTAATIANAAGTTKELDYVGMLYQYQARLKETKQTLTALKNVTDAADPNLTILNDDLLTFS